MMARKPHMGLQVRAVVKKGRENPHVRKLMYPRRLSLDKGHRPVQTILLNIGQYILLGPLVELIDEVTKIIQRLFTPITEEGRLVTQRKEWQSLCEPIETEHVLQEKDVGIRKKCMLDTGGLHKLTKPKEAAEAIPFIVNRVHARMNIIFHESLFATILVLKPTKAQYVELRLAS